VGKRIDVSYDVLGHPYHESRPVEEGRHYKVLAYTDWADTFVPTVVQWNHGEVDSFTDPARSRVNQQKAVNLERRRHLRKAVTEMKRAAKEEKEKHGKPGPFTLKDLRYYQERLKAEREEARRLGMDRAKAGIRTRRVGTIADLQGREDLSLVTEQQDVQAVKDHLGGRGLEGFDGFLVKVGDGDYTEVYGFRGSVPSLGKPVYAVEPDTRMSRSIRLPRAQRRFDGLTYTEHTGAYTMKEAQAKARDIRSRGYHARVVKTGPGYTVYARKKEAEPGSSRRLRAGDRVQVTGGSGLDSGKTGTVVDRGRVKTDGGAVPTNIPGAYKPVDWSREAAVELDDGTLITMPRARLREVER